MSPPPATHKAPTSTALTGRWPADKRHRLIPLLAFAIALIARCPAQIPATTPQTTPGAPQPEPQPATSQSQSLVPAAPTQRNALASILSAESCDVRNTGATVAATAAMRGLAVSGLNAVPLNAGTTPVIDTLCVPHMPIINWYARFLNGPEVKPLTPEEKARLAAHNLLDPFNLLTIGGEAAIAIAINSHSAYGPGVPGWGRNVGVSFTQDMTGEFFDTFLIPSLVHQDPHYHRMPDASVKRRILHATAQVLWTQGDNGNGMINYGNVVGFAIDGAISNLYVPGQRTNVPSTVARYGTGLATAPIDNYVIEFLPDVARRIHIQIVVIQRIINKVARNDASTTP